MVIKKDINEDGNPNCTWKRIKLLKDFKSLQEAKDFLNNNFTAIVGKYNFYMGMEDGGEVGNSGCKEEMALLAKVANELEAERQSHDDLGRLPSKSELQVEVESFIAPRDLEEKYAKAQEEINHYIYRGNYSMDKFVQEDFNALSKVLNDMEGDVMGKEDFSWPHVVATTRKLEAARNDTGYTDWIREQDEAERFEMADGGEVPPIKLTAKQKEIITLMRDGWNLVLSNRSGRYFLRKDGNNKTVDVNANTFKFLNDNEHKFVIMAGFEHPLRKYELTELGKTIEL